MTELPDLAMLMSMVREGRATTHEPMKKITINEATWDELLRLIDDQAKTIQGIHQVIANMKSNLGSHATFLEQLEVLVGNGDQL
jgi:hypothetical protein